MLKHPVISTYVAGMPELVIDDEYSWLVPAALVLDLTNAMEAILSAIHQRLIDMGEVAYSRLRQRHNIDNEVSKLASLFLESVV